MIPVALSLFSVVAPGDSFPNVAIAWVASLTAWDKTKEARDSWPDFLPTPRSPRAN